MQIRNTLAAVLAAGAISGLSPAEARADDWGCKVLLCLGDPRGPTTEAECVPPIHRLWRELARGRGMPSCDMRGSAAAETGTYARIGRDWYDPCPAGTAPATGLVMLAGESRYYRGTPVRDDETGRPTRRACVGNMLRRVGVTEGDGNVIRVPVYDRVVWQEAAATPAVIDVFIDRQLWTRSRIGQ